MNTLKSKGQRERRAAPRIRVMTSAVIRDGERARTGRLRDISATGALIGLTTPLDRFDVFSTDALFVELEIDGLPCLGARAERRSGQEIAAEFDHDTASAEAVRRFVAEQSRKSSCI
jgi:hypothetical protein